MILKHSAVPIAELHGEHVTDEGVHCRRSEKQPAEAGCLIFKDGVLGAGTQNMPVTVEEVDNTQA